MSDPWTLLTPELVWLRARCMRAASTRPGLDGEDLCADVVADFIHEAPAWYAHSETLVSPRARARHLLNILVMRRLTTWDREQRKHVVLKPTDEGTGLDWWDALPAPDLDIEGWMDAARVTAAVDGLPNPRDRLLLRAFYRPARVERPDFDAAASSFLRELHEAWAHFRRERGVDRADPDWRRVLAEIIRVALPWGEAPDAVMKTARYWLDKNLRKAQLVLAGRFVMETR